MDSASSFTPQFDRHVPEFYRIFSLLDTKKDGQLDAEELQHLLKTLGRESKSVEIDELMKFIKGSSTVTPSSHPIDFSVFLAWVNISLQEGPLESQLTGIFEVLDVDKDGKISPHEFTSLVQQLGVPFDLDDAKRMLGGDVDFATFCNLISKGVPSTTSLNKPLKK